MRGGAVCETAGDGETGTVLEADGDGATGAALVQRQPEFTPEWLAGELAKAADNLPALQDSAEKARSVAVPDAAGRLADLVFTAAGR